MILYLGPVSPLVEFLMKREPVMITEAPIDFRFIEQYLPAFLVSYGYRHIISPDILWHMGTRAINLHCGYLPYNRGAHPNFWSWVEGTPKGVTIHAIDAGIDTGDILVQREVKLSLTSDFDLTYRLLQLAMVDLFKENWDAIRAGTIERKPQTMKTVLHKKADIEPYLKFMPQGWDTPIHRFIDNLAASRLEESANMWKD